MNIAIHVEVVMFCIEFWKQYFFLLLNGGFVQELLEFIFCCRLSAKLVDSSAILQSVAHNMIKKNVMGLHLYYFAI